MTSVSNEEIFEFLIEKLGLDVPSYWNPIESEEDYRDLMDNLSIEIRSKIVREDALNQAKDANNPRREYVLRFYHELKKQNP